MPKVPRNNSISLKLSDAEYERLEKLMTKLEKSQSETIRYALRMLYSEINV